MKFCPFVGGGRNAVCKPHDCAIAPGGKCSIITIAESLQKIAGTMATENNKEEEQDATGRNSQ